jgi:F-type H+-transporting ATPase subunit epsilon
VAGKSFRCKLVTPTAALVDDAIVYASVPLWDGLAGILPGRAPMLGRLGLGELRLDFADSAKGEGGTRAFMIDGGFAKMSEEGLTILAESAIATENIRLADAETELKAADGPATAKPGETAAAAAERRTKERDVARLKVALAKKQGGI